MEPKPKESALRYMPQMDSLRAFAVFGVLVQHWFTAAVPVGSWGVILFFVISGYLITHTLHRLRDSGISLHRAAQVFFVRRSARLIPAYFALLAIWAVFSPQFRSDWLWYVMYGSNILLNSRQDWIALTPSWSLSVEEQFYLAWFPLVMLVKPKSLMLPMAVLVMAAPVARMIYALDGNSFGNYLLWSNLDALVIGALLSVLERGGGTLPSRAVRLALIAGLALPLIAAYGWTVTVIGNSLVPLLVALIAAALVWRSRTGFQRSAGWLLSQTSLIYLGKISYGIYLFHMLVLALSTNIAKSTSHPSLSTLFKAESLQGFALYVGLTLLLAAASFKYLETPVREWAVKKLT